jgi:hypothetical protein
MRTRPLATVSSIHHLDTPEAVALDIACYGNPSQLSAQQWWQTNRNPQSGERAVGPLALTSGIIAYVSQGQSQTAYTVYTLTHSTSACQMVSYQTDPANSRVILAVINTFVWK